MRKATSGFTLIEIMVVVAIIGILSTVVTMSFFSIQTNTHDSQRSSQITIIQSALEKYYSQNGEYPSCNAMAQTPSTVTTTTLSGILPDVLTTPTASKGTNSILPLCGDLAVGIDSFAYVGDSSCVTSPGTTCLQYTLKYRSESNNSVISVNSKHAPAGNVAAPSSTPIITVTLNGSNIQANITPVSCVTGSIPQYGINSRTNDGTWIGYTAWSTLVSATQVANQGVKYGYMAQARCYVDATHISSASTGTEGTYINTITAPAAPVVAVATSSPTTTIFLTSGASWTVPADWNNANNKIEVIGSGGGGAGTYYSGNGTYDSGNGGGGGGYSALNNKTLTPGSAISYSVQSTDTVARTNGGSTWFINATTLLAEGGKTTSAGGLATNGFGDVKYSGGTGSAPMWDYNYYSGGGGGGAAGPNGNGMDGVGSPTNYGFAAYGGAGDNGHGGGGGYMANGGAGAEWDSTHGSGGGSGAYGSFTAGHFTGGKYGGGGAGNSGWFGDTASYGAPGLIVITYTPAPQTKVFLASGTSWTVPADWNNANNSIEVIGGGGNGDQMSNNYGSGGGGGGAYSKKTNLSLTAGNTVAYVVGGVSGDTYFNGASYGVASVGAKAGANGFNGLSGASGLASGGIGDVKYSGGHGGDMSAPNPYYGGGGGGAAGSHGNGNAGANGNPSGGGAGGQGDVTYGGGGGAAAPSGSTGGTGGNGTEWDSSHGSGGGGGGGGGGNAGQGYGGVGGLYGSGGGGAGGGGGFYHGGGAGTQGLIVITYTPVVPASTTTYSWPAVTCASGTTARYQYNYVIDYSGGYTSSWYSTAGLSSTYNTSSEGYQYTSQVQAQCYTAIASSSWGPIGQASYIRPVANPGPITFGITRTSSTQINLTFASSCTGGSPLDSRVDIWMTGSYGGYTYWWNPSGQPGWWSTVSGGPWVWDTFGWYGYSFSAGVAISGGNTYLSGMPWQSAVEMRCKNYTTGRTSASTGRVVSPVLYAP